MAGRPVGQLHSKIRCSISLRLRDAKFEDKVFADSFPVPVLLKTEIDIIVQPKQMKLSELIPNLESLRKAAEREKDNRKDVKSTRTTA